MTESDGALPGWVPVLRDFARTSGHELRNALNALVVNLEVVRSRSGAVDEQTRHFVDQAVEQSEESVRLAEGTIALLNLVVGAVGESGVLDIQYSEPLIARIAASEADASRLARALQPTAQHLLDRLVDIVRHEWPPSQSRKPSCWSLR